MENMDESFELLSSMSPKLRGRQKTVKKAIKILALKKHFRRSSIYDKAPAVNNQDLAITERSSETTETSSNFQRINKIDKNGAIIVIDSTDSEGTKESLASKSKKLSLKLLKDCDNDGTKVDRIQEWLDDIEISRNKDNLTFFGQVSTIYGDDEAPKLDCEGEGLAASSTFNEYITRRFDELFVTDKKDPKNKPNDDLNCDDSFSVEINTSLRSKLKKKSPDRAENISFDESSNDSINLQEKANDFTESNKVKTIVIDETLLTSDESFGKHSDYSFKDLKLSPKRTVIAETLPTSDKSIIKLSDKAKTATESPHRTPERAVPIRDEYITTRKKNAKSLQDPKEGSLGLSVEMESMLDSLYGEKWRKKHNHVLPLSEPKKKPTTINQKNVLVPNSVRVMKPSNKENIQSKLNPATRKLKFDKIKTPVESPWMNRLKGLVDSDSDSNAEDTTEKTKGMENVKTRLNFCDDSPLTKATNSNIQKTEKRCSKNEKINKENYPTTNKDKGKVKNKKQTQIKNKEQPVLESDDKKTTVKKTNKKILKSKSDNKRSLKSTSSSNSCSDIEISSDEEYDREITRMYEIKRKSIKPLKAKSYSFLESLSAHVPLDKCDMAARIFRTSFKHYRDALKSKLFSLYNEKVFDNVIPSDTELEWNDKLRNTAGLCYCKKITHKNGEITRKVKISLSSKVLDSPDRLRDTLIHEMCHAGTWIVNQISNGHGIYWKNWAFKAMKVFPELPPIKRCHSYQINTKYTYKCTGCGYSFGRHSKSLDTERKRCGHCYGKFELLINKTSKTGVTKTVPVTPRKQATAFQLFIKENYSRYKEPTKKHGDVMKILGQKFSELKVKNNT